MRLENEMSKLKVGDKVKRVSGCEDLLPMGYIGTVTKIATYGYCCVDGIHHDSYDGCPFAIESFILVEEEDMKPNVIDIRKQEKPVVVDTIIVADALAGNPRDIQGVCNRRTFIYLKGGTDNDIIFINNKQDCENLILGLQKALELGWL